MLEEKKKFLEKCSKKDKEKLLGKTEMSFEDFERFLFLAETFGFMEYQKEIFESYISRFSSIYAEMDRFFGKDAADVEEVEEYREKRKKWSEDFHTKLNN